MEDRSGLGVSLSRTHGGDKSSFFRRCGSRSSRIVSGTRTWSNRRCPELFPAVPSSRAHQRGPIGFRVLPLAAQLRMSNDSTIGPGAESLNVGPHPLAGRLVQSVPDPCGVRVGVPVPKNAFTKLLGLCLAFSGVVERMCLKGDAHPLSVPPAPGCNPWEGVCLQSASEIRCHTADQFDTTSEAYPSAADILETIADKSTGFWRQTREAAKMTDSRNDS